MIHENYVPICICNLSDCTHNYTAVFVISTVQHSIYTHRCHPLKHWGGTGLRWRLVCWHWCPRWSCRSLTFLFQLCRGQLRTPWVCQTLQQQPWLWPTSVAAVSHEPSKETFTRQTESEFTDHWSPLRNRICLGLWIWVLLFFLFFF